MNLGDPLTIEEIEKTQEFLKTDSSAHGTPLLPLNVDFPDKKIYLKFENLSPIGSFKIRGALNCLKHITKDDVADGVFTASAGNFAQGILWACNQRNISCTILVPESTPVTKLAAIERLGGAIVKLPFDDWWRVIETSEYSGLPGMKFIHPVLNRDIIMGNSVIGKEILDELPDVDTVLVSYGGGALSCGIGWAFKALKPSVKVIVCEIETASPFNAALEAGKPVVKEITKSFIDAIGSRSVLPPMFEIARKVVDDAVIVSVDSVVSAIKLIAERNRVITEGAGAVTVAAAVQGLAGGGNIACVISGGNIDTDKLVQVLKGITPQP